MKNEMLRMQLLANLITEEQYKQKLMEELQYFHNGAEGTQIINYDDSDITDDLEFLGQGSMDGQDFIPGETYNIGGQEYKIESQGDEFKLVLNKNLPPIEKKQVKGQINAKKRQQELINRGYKLGKDFTVVQDPNNKIMYNISPITEDRGRIIKQRKV